MSARSLALLFACVFVGLLVVLMPLRLGLAWMGAEERGLSASAVHGAVWRGRLEDASLAGAALGDAKVGLDPLGLFTGGGRLSFALTGPLTGSGAIQLGRSHLALEGVDLVTPSERLAPNLPIQGRLTLRAFEATFRGRTCERAGGEARLDQLRLAAAPAPGLALTGRPACRGSVLVLPLAGQAEGVDVQAVLSLEANGTYRLETVVRATRPDFEMVAGLAGFERGIDGYRRVDRGRLGAS